MKTYAGVPLKMCAFKKDYRCLNMTCHIIVEAKQHVAKSGRLPIAFVNQNDLAKLSVIIKLSCPQ